MCLNCQDTNASREQDTAEKQTSGGKQNTTETQSAEENLGVQGRMGAAAPLDRRRSSTWGPTKNQQKRKKNINSLLNATALPLFMAILVTVVKDGEAYTFYTTLMPLTLIGITLQLAVAIILVCKKGLSYHPEEVNEEKKRNRIHASTFDMWMQILTVISLAINLAVNAFFTARVRKS